MKAAVERTHDNGVLRGVGSFGGVFSRRRSRRCDDPVLVASTDGVGTKVELAARLGMVRGVGMDIVNHCIDDVLVQSARPLFFLDYIAASVLDADLVAEVVGGMAEACRGAGCALLGGETAEMPGVYAPGAFDIAGTLVGVAERDQLLPRADVAAGDVLIGVGSSGPHTNGYSLLRKVFEWVPMDATPEGFDRPLGETLLEPHRSYLDVLDAGARQRARQGARPHHRRRAAREPAAGAARRRRRGDRARLVARAAAVPAGRASCATDGDRGAVPHGEHGHRHGRDVRPDRRARRPGVDRRGDVGHRPLDRRAHPAARTVHLITS